MASVVACVACGEVIQKSYERRCLAKCDGDIFLLWKNTLQIVLDDQCDIDLDAIGNDDHRYVCRKCLNAYQKLLKAQAVVQEKASNAVQFLTEIESATEQACHLPPPKRPRLSPMLVASSSVSVVRSPDVAVQVNYKKPRTYQLTPTRKHIGKAVARGSKKTVALECLRDPATRAHLLKRMGVVIRNEMKAMCTDSRNSILRSGSTEDLKNFTWDTLLNEADETAPMLSTILKECTRTKRFRSNTHAVIGICLSILLKHRFQKMSLVQKIMTLILYAGHSGKQVYERLQKVNLSMSHQSCVRLVTKLGDGFDYKIVKWRDEKKAELLNQREGNAKSISYADRLGVDNYSSSEESEIDDENEPPTPPMSPLTSDDEFNLSDDEPENVDTLSLSADESSSDEHYSSDCDRLSSMQVADIQQSTTQSCLQQSTQPKQLGYKIVGDNLDKSVKARYIRTGNAANRLLHFFHLYAVKDRIDFSHLPDVYPPTCLPSPNNRMITILPSADDDKAIRRLFAVQVSRALVTYVPFFKLGFEDVVEWHVEHDHYSEMSQTSEVIPLGVLTKNENAGGDMADIMTHIQGYVPAVELSTQIHVDEEAAEIHDVSLHHILFGGDQLTAARARGAQRARLNAEISSLRFDGIVPCAEDWHTKLNFVEVIWKYFYSKESGQDHGTLYQLRNLLHRSNVPKEPKKNFNACEDFLKTIVTGHIIAASLKVLNMSSIDDKPSLPSVPNLLDLTGETKECRKKALDKVCEAVVDKYISFQFHGTELKANDGVFEYATQIVSVGCFYHEFADAIREGDGNRVLRCWKYLMTIFHSSGRTNYSFECLTMLRQHFFLLTPRKSAELLWSRFINTVGRRGRNIPADMHMEHLNRICKGALTGLGSNKSHRKAITRVAEALGTLTPVLSNFDAVNNVADTTSYHKPPSQERDVKMTVEQLQRSDVFSVTAERSHASFSSVRQVLHCEERTQLKKWMITRV